MKKTEPRFHDVHGEFRERIHHYLVRLVGQGEADDLTQEVFLKVNKGLDNFRGDSKLSTWVYRIATNTALDRLRSSSFRRKNRQVSLSGSNEEPERDLEDRAACTGKKPSVREQAVKREASECIRSFVDRLPVSYRTVLVLSELKDLKNQEIADILGISLDTVKIRLHRARARLKKEFEAGCELYRDGENVLSCDRKS